MSMANCPKSILFSALTIVVAGIGVLALIIFSLIFMFFIRPDSIRAVPLCLLIIGLFYCPMRACRTVRGLLNGDSNCRKRYVFWVGVIDLVAIAVCTYETVSLLVKIIMAISAAFVTLSFISLFIGAARHWFKRDEILGNK